MDDVQIATTIAEQLGGSSRISAMIGAHTFTAGEHSLTFKFKMRATNGSNCFRVTLDLGSDTYNVEFISIRGASFKVKKQLEGVYAEDLREIFERETGLYLKF